MNLLWGVPGDPPLDAVLGALLRRRAPTLLLDQRRTRDVAIELTLDQYQYASGYLRNGSKRLGVEEISGIYLRPEHRSSVAAELDDALLVLADLAPATVLNRPAAMAANGSKPYQYRQIAAVGFRLPDTLITTSPGAAREFMSRHERVVYKSISGVRSIVAELRPEDESRLGDVVWCPTQLQERIAGVDVRVHVVGDLLFACEVSSEAVDYRYASRSGQGVELSRCELQDDVAERCIRLAHDSGLQLAGIDLRRTPEDDWYCLEANPSPGFTYYERATGQPIADAIAALLTGSERQRGRWIP